MKYKVMGGHWGEGYKSGDIINIDLEAAKLRLELGELIEVNDEEVTKKEANSKELNEKNEEITGVATSEVVIDKAKRGRPKINKI